MRSVLFVKIEAPTYSSIAMVNGFKENGFTVMELDWQHIRFSEGIIALREQILEVAERRGPDLIFLHLQNSDVLTVELATRLQELSFVVNFTEDVREDTTWYENIAPHIGLTIFTNRNDVHKLRQMGIPNVEYLQTSYNDVWYKKLSRREDVDYGEIIFIGNNTVGTNLNFPLAQQRVDMVEFMKKHFGHRFRVYGIGWPGSRMLNPQECITAYNNCKIAITHNQFYRDGYQSDRGFNAMGCGACTIVNYYPNIENDFHYIESWDTFDILKKKCELALQYEDRRVKVFELTHHEVLSRHRWANRFAELKTIISKHTKQPA